MNARASAIHRALREQWGRAECEHVVIDLPRPPSVNNLTTNHPVHGRVPTPRYASWLRAAGNELNGQKPGRVDGAYELTLLVGIVNDKRRRDLGNLEKAVSDLLVEHHVIADDSLARRIVIEWVPHVTGIRVMLQKSSTPA